MHTRRPFSVTLARLSAEIQRHLNLFLSTESKDKDASAFFTAQDFVQAVTADADSLPERCCWISLSFGAECPGIFRCAKPNKREAVQIMFHEEPPTNPHGGAYVNLLFLPSATEWEAWLPAQKNRFTAKTANPARDSWIRAALHQVLPLAASSE